jgi:hypothetical protein
MSKHTKDQKAVLKKVADKAKEAEKLLGEACAMLREHKLIFHFSVSPLSQTYSGLKEEIMDDGFEIFPGWEHSAIC